MSTAIAKSIPPSHTKAVRQQRSAAAKVRNAALMANTTPINHSLQQHAQQHGLADVLLMDPPWGYGRSNLNNMSTATPHMHYPCMSDEDLLAMGFAQVSSRDALCFMWVPSSQLELAMAMLANNGFKFVTVATWHKTRSKGGPASCPTNGAVLPMSEMVVMGRRGSGLPIDSTASKIPGVFQALRTGHSVKPTCVHDWLAALYPQRKDGSPVTRLELFARNAAPGWTVWGNQAPTTAAVLQAVPTVTPAPLAITAIPINPFTARRMAANTSLPLVLQAA